MDPETYTEDFVDIGIRRKRIIKEKIYEVLKNGGTIVLNRCELVSDTVRDICMQVGRLTGTQTTANLYASIGGDPATNIHWDTHDVCVVQLLGAKHWTLYPPTFELPLNSQTSNGFKDEIPKQPFFETVLKEGDILYVPRGWWHRVSPIENTDTISATVAIHTPLMIDYIIWACSAILPGHVSFRRTLMDGKSDGKRVAEALESLQTVLGRDDVIQAFIERTQMKERVVSGFDVARLLKNRKVNFLDSNHIRINSRTSSSQGRVSINGVRLSLPDDMQKVINFVAKFNSISIEEIKNNIPDLEKDRLEDILRQFLIKDLVELCGNPD